jgi:hypothetical protein
MKEIDIAGLLFLFLLSHQSVVNKGVTVGQRSSLNIILVHKPEFLANLGRVHMKPFLRVFFQNSLVNPLVKLQSKQAMRNHQL